ncbi:hypothetical protein BH10CYA1_BH10CYA1_61770 [soil metagenome]
MLNEKRIIAEGARLILVQLLFTASISTAHASTQQVTICPSGGLPSFVELSPPTASLSLSSTTIASSSLAMPRAVDTVHESQLRKNNPLKKLGKLFADLLLVDDGSIDGIYSISSF